MSTLAQIQKEIAPELERLSIRIKGQLESGNPMMNSVVENYLRTKGKQIRPIVVILTAKMFGDVSDKVLSAAASVELLHNASLIHDDVVDNTSLRRNAPTINAIWDNHIAVLVGDFFVSSALQQAILTDDLRIVDALCSLGKLLSLGELDQIYNARFHKLSEEDYFKIIDQKTASLFVACARLGCYAVGVDPQQVEKVVSFAHLLGLCFQIRDDIYDYFSGEDIGKPTGNDLREGKVTLPLLHVLLDEEEPRHREMIEILGHEMLSEEEISELIAYARENGGIEYAYAKMREMREKAAQIMAQLPQSQASAALMSIFDSIITPNK